MAGLDFYKMWEDPIIRDANPGEALGGNLKNLGNYCCVRTTHALLSAGHKITIASDYKDKYGNKYIIKVVTMKSYMSNNFGSPTRLTSKEGGRGRNGIVCFDNCGFSDATGHFDLWNGNSMETAYGEYWSQAKDVFLWQF